MPSEVLTLLLKRVSSAVKACAKHSFFSSNDSIQKKKWPFSMGRVDAILKHTHPFFPSLLLLNGELTYLSSPFRVMCYSAFFFFKHYHFLNLSFPLTPMQRSQNQRNYVTLRVTIDFP